MFKFMSLASSLQSLRNIYGVIALLLWFENGGLGLAWGLPGDFCVSTVPPLDGGTRKMYLGLAGWGLGLEGITLMMVS